MASTTVAKLPPYPSHPYRSSMDLAQLLVNNGLTGISVQDLAGRIDLVGYYRLKGYWYPFLTPVAGARKRKLPFLPRTSWDSIWERYVFDQELRTIVFDGIVGIEVHLKSYMASELAKATGPFGYTLPDGLPGLSPEEHRNAIANITSDYQRSSLPQLRHFRATYSDPLPPIWMLVDCLSYGDFKKIFYKGADPSIKRQLALQLGIMSNKPGVSNEKLLRDWLENIRIARNKTAHHDRFWNCIDPKMTPIKPKLYPNDATWWGNQWEPFRRPESKGPAGFLTMEHYLLNQLGITYWRNNFVGLMNRYPGIPLKHMGFPDNWQSLPIWQ